MSSTLEPIHGVDRRQPIVLGVASADVARSCPTCIGHRSSSPIAAFPVYWMVLTSFRRGVDIQTADPAVRSRRPARSHNYRKVFDRDFFWTAVRNSLTVTLLVLVLALVHRVPRRRRRVAVPVPRPQGVHHHRSCWCRWCRPRR